MTRRYPLTNHKRGDSFAREITVTIDGAPANLAGATATASVVAYDYSAVATLTCDTTSAATGVIVISAMDTSAWPLSDAERPLLLDVKLVLSGETFRTETLGVVLDREITA